MNIATSPVLVLNKSWVPLRVTTLKTAFKQLTKVCTNGVHKGEPKARIIDATRDFQTFSWEDWSKIRPMPGDDVIRGIGNDFHLFDVIMLTEYDQQPSKRLRFSRRTIWRRDNSHCQYCGVKCSEKAGNEGTIDHVLPKSQGGLTTWENTVLCCCTCNAQKADRIPEMAVKNPKSRIEWRGPSPMRLLSVPKKPKLTLLKGDRKTMRPSWKNFVSAAFWEVELENDNPK